MRNTFKRGVAAIAVALGTLIWAGAAPAAADPWGDTFEITDPATGKWKASAWYDDSTNTVYIRAYNSVSSAFAEMWVYDQFGNELRHFKDFGGDDAPSHRSVSLGYNGTPATFYFRHVNSSGDVSPGDMNIWATF